MSLLDPPDADFPTFLDHCVVNPAWIEAASVHAVPPRFDWHPKIAKALDLIAAHARDFDRNVYQFRGLESGDVADEIGHLKIAFHRNQVILTSVVARVSRTVEHVFDALRNCPPELRSQGWHTFAAAASLSVIRHIQRFEGSLFSESGQRVVRIFPDLPSFRLTRGPFVGLPFHHSINQLAYGYRAQNGFLYCRVSRGREGDYEYVYLPRFDAEAHQDFRPGPSYLYFGWVVPQWLLTFDDPPPSQDRWWITVISDERGTERYTSIRESPWSGPDALQLEWPSEYKWPNEFYVRVDVVPGLSCWVARSSSRRQGLQTSPAVGKSQSGNSNQSVDSIVPSEGHSESGRSVLCIAAAHAEFTAVISQLTREFGRGCIHPLSDSAGYAVKFLDLKTGDVWFVASLTFQGETEAGLGVKTFAAALAPSLVLMVGMCMGMPGRKLKTGTVVVPNEVFGFDHQRLTSEGTTYRPHGFRADTNLYRLARIVGAQDFTYPVVLDKALASASAKVENANGILVQTIEKFVPDAAAYDMEGWGFYLASVGMQCLWIKAVADGGEAQGRSSVERDAKHAVQSEVTLNALDFAIRLVREHRAAHSSNSGNSA